MTEPQNSEDALFYACKRANHDLIMLLISYGASPLTVNAKGASALEYIFETKNFPMIQHLLSSQSFDVNSPLDVLEHVIQTSPFYRVVSTRYQLLSNQILFHFYNCWSNMALI